MPTKSSGASRSSSSKPAAKAAPKVAAPKAPAKPANNVRHVVQDKTAGDWKVKEPKTAKPTAAAPTQKKAEAAAKKQVSAAGGGEVKIHGRDGKIRDSDTVKPGNESKAKDTKH